MRTNTLISRIARLVETGGASGDGAALAQEYATAVNKANARLDAVIAAIDSNAISDAIRLLSEDPPLMEELGALDFFQLADWEGLCDINGWEMPPKIDRPMMERVVEVAERKDAIAPFLTLYKKAVRTNDRRLAVKSLRRLAALDRSQDWSRNLRQAERQLQTLLVQEFIAARQKGEADACERLAAELLDGKWLDAPSVSGLDEVRAFRAQTEANRRETEAREDIEILRTSLSEKWDHKRALALLQALDGFVAQGWKMPEDAAGVVADCRVRCARELAKEEADKRWREVNEALHAAVQKEDCEAIRAALSVPEFLDRNPDGDLLSQAEDVLDHADAARRRKTFQIASFAFLSVLAVLGVSGWWLRQKIFAGHCADVVKNLAYFERQAKDLPELAIEGLQKSIAKLKTETPEIYADPKVAQFEMRLQAIVAENAGRTNQIVRTLSELEAMCSAGWREELGKASVTDRIGAVERLLVRGDMAYRVRLLKVKNSWIEAVAASESERRARATKFQKTLVSHLQTVASRLRSELARDDLKQEVASCRASLKEWKTLHSSYAEDAAAKLTEVEKTFNEAIEEQVAYTNALETLRQAKDALAVVTAREDLIKTYGQYPQVKFLKTLDVRADEIKDALSAEPSAVSAYVKGLNGGISSDEFAIFLKENVQIIADSPDYYSLYGIVKVDKNLLLAVSKGKPSIDKPSYEKTWKITCNSEQLLDFAEEKIVTEMKGSCRVKDSLMPSSDEMRTIVEVANRSNLTLAAFEGEVLRLIDQHIRAGHAKDFLENEKKFATYYNPPRGWMSPFRRVQFLAWYMRWLKEDLKLMPNDAELIRWHEKLTRLAGSVAVDGVDESFAWLCIWDTRIRRRQIDCAELLNELPENWVGQYRNIRRTNRAFAAVDGWKVEFAGIVGFDPLDPSFEKEPESIRVRAPNVTADHPLYVLRKVKGHLTLVRAFEPGRATWRMCAEVGRTKEGYVLGEPLYHVFAEGKFIDVQEELRAIAKREKIDVSDARLKQIPLYSNGGK